MRWGAATRIVYYCQQIAPNLKENLYFRKKLCHMCCKSKAFFEKHQKCYGVDIKNVNSNGDNVEL